MKHIQSDLIYLGDMRDAIKEIDSFLAEEKRDLKTYRAVERNLEIIGEASSRISDDIKIKYPHIKWRQIKGMWNFISHEYSRVVVDMVWSVADDDLGILLENIEEIIKNHSS